MTQDQAAPGTLKTFVTSLLISCTLVAPFIVLQWVNRRTFHEDFPFVLFTFMSLHSLFIVLLLAPAVRRLGSEGNLRALKLGHWAGLVLSSHICVCRCGYRSAPLLPRGAELRLRHPEAISHRRRVSWVQ
jgi:hypothetical protein